MNIKINNKDVETSVQNLQALAEEMNLPEQGVAIAIDNKMIPRAEWSEQSLHEGENIVIIKAACGG
ncbi:MAG: sulfur carrier protein ThiS [Bacteroidaceae bacterium]|nr:sulfur carrier protein ThiS [Bacteroidaceae bacterium]